VGLLDDETIWRGKVFTGEWTATGHTAEATEPATGDVLGEVGTASAEVLSRCAERAATAGGEWARMPYQQRAGVLRRAAALFEERRAAAAAGAYGSFAHQGQICMATGRHLVAEPIAALYTNAVAKIADGLTVGDRARIGVEPL